MQSGESEKHINEYISKAPTFTIYDGLVKAKSVLATHNNVLVSVSGGADSDCMIDIVEHLRVRDEAHKITYVFFDTGIELDATKRHLNYLEEKYNIKIIRRRAKVTVAAAVIKEGIPYLSKDASQRIHELQLHNFDWSEGSIEELNDRFPHCVEGIKWWTGNKGRFSLPKSRHDFMHENPPTFKISHRCCYHAKKKPSADMEKEIHADLVLLGLRKYEGGARAAKSKCFDPAGNTHKTDRYYPCFWWEDIDKQKFENVYGIIHSDAYTVYGLKRTGCLGCPFNAAFESELSNVRPYEPQLVNAVEHIFAPSYEYTRAYRKYKEQRTTKRRQNNE